MRDISVVTGSTCGQKRVLFSQFLSDLSPIVSREERVINRFLIMGEGKRDFGIWHKVLF